MEERKIGSKEGSKIKLECKNGKKMERKRKMVKGGRQKECGKRKKEGKKEGEKDEIKREKEKRK